MTKASLYYHYPSKQALLLAILEPLITSWQSTIAKTETLPHTPANLRLLLREFLDVLLRHRTIAGLFARDTAAVFHAIGPLFQELLDLQQKLHSWLAGPSPSAPDRIRAIAATEALGTALSWSPHLAEVSDDELRSVLLDAAGAVLRLRRRGAHGRQRNATASNAAATSNE